MTVVFDFLGRSIPRKILGALVAIFCATYLATALVVYSGVRASILDSNKVALNQVADLKYEKLANVIGDLATNLTAWSELEVMNDLVSGDIDKRVTQSLESLKRLYGFKGDIYAFDGNGKMIASSSVVRDGDATVKLPAAWRSDQGGLVFLDKEIDPFTGNAGIALETPVFGSFDKNYRIGTLVMTYPWTAVEEMLFSLETGTVLIEKGKSARILAANPPNIAERAGLTVAAADAVNTEFVVGRSILRDGVIRNWQILALESSEDAIRPLQSVAVELALLGLVLGVPIVLLGRWISHKLTAPIEVLTRVAGEIADTDKLDARVPVTSSDELGSLAQSFNRMTATLERTTQEREQVVRELAGLNQTLEAKIAARTEELEEAIAAQRRLIADISHEVKSPLARLSMALGLARRSPETAMAKQFDRMEKEIENIAALASELLTLARLDADIAPPEFELTDLAALVMQIVADAGYEHPDRRSDLSLREPCERASVLGNPNLLRRAIENVVRNAIFYTSEGTNVEIALATKTSGYIAVVVADRGPGVPAAAVDHLFEPFYRVDEARARETGGSGIGLAICARVVKLHGGSVSAKNALPHGLIVEIELPLAPFFR